MASTKNRFKPKRKSKRVEDLYAQFISGVIDGSVPAIDVERVKRGWEWVLEFTPSESQG